MNWGWQLNVSSYGTMRGAQFTCGSAPDPYWSASWWSKLLRASHQFNQARSRPQGRIYTNGYQNVSSQNEDIRTQDISSELNLWFRTVTYLKPAEICLSQILILVLSTFIGIPCSVDIVSNHCDWVLLTLLTLTRIDSFMGNDCEVVRTFFSALTAVMLSCSLGVNSFLLHYLGNSPHSHNPLLIDFGAYTNPQKEKQVLQNGHCKWY